jgi:hypothetical protein
LHSFRAECKINCGDASENAPFQLIGTLGTDALAAEEAVDLQLLGAARTIPATTASNSSCELDGEQVHATMSPPSSSTDCGNRAHGYPENS